MAAMLTLLGRMARRLADMLAETAELERATDIPEADTEDMISEAGEHPTPLTSFGYLRELLPTLRTVTPPQPGAVMTQDEVAAWDMLAQHRFSREELARQGELDDYLSLGVSEKTEARWRWRYVKALLDGYERCPEGLDLALLIGAESGDAPTLERAIEVLDDAISAEQMPGEATLGGCLSTLLALEAGRFDAAYAADARQRLMESVARAEYRLGAYDPDGAWRGVLEEIRRRWPAEQTHA